MGDLCIWGIPIRGGDTGDTYMGSTYGLRVTSRCEKKHVF